MWVKHLESGDYLDRVEEIAALADSATLAEAKKEPVEILERRAAVLEEVRAILGNSVRVAVDGPANNVAAFVETYNWQAYMVEGTLDDRSFAIYAAQHERQHQTNKISNVDLEAELEADEIKILEEATGLENLAEIDLLEGFNDWITIRKHGRHERSGYLDEEVPAAERLEALCQEWTGKSLREAFDRGNLQQFYDRLIELSQVLALKEFLKAA